jgi:hypothetical protein
LSAPNIRLAVSTCGAYRHATLPILLPSLARAGFPPSEILVVVGDSERERVEDWGGIEARFVTHNSYDHNATVEIVEKDLPGDWWFLMHDTCRAGATFREKLHGFGTPAEYVSLTHDGYLCMGLYARTFLQREKNFFLSLKNMNKMQAILVERICLQMCRSDRYHHESPTILEGTFDVFGDGHDRHQYHFPHLDLYKYQKYFMGAPVLDDLFASFGWELRPGARERPLETQRDLFARYRFERIPTPPLR